MKFLLTYRERHGEVDPAAAQRRSARLLNERAMPPGLSVRELLSRVGGGGGFAVVETASADDLQHIASLFAAYDCEVQPVLDVPYNGAARATFEEPASAASQERPLPEMPAGEPREGAFSDDDVYDTED